MYINIQEIFETFVFHGRVFLSPKLTDSSEKSSSSISMLSDCMSLTLTTLTSVVYLFISGAASEFLITFAGYLLFFALVSAAAGDFILMLRSSPEVISESKLSSSTEPSCMLFWSLTPVIFLVCNRGAMLIGLLQTTSSSVYYFFYNLILKASKSYMKSFFFLFLVVRSDFKDTASSISIGSLFMLTKSN